ncbi:MAG: hypothetical protein RIB60_10915 [Phycisphaerales bacterium]
MDVQRVRLAFRVIAWVIMRDHVHLILLPDAGQIGPILRGIKQGFGQRMIHRWRECGAQVLTQMTDPQGTTRFWQRGGGYDRNVRDLGELREKIRYIHTNPVRRGLAERETDWAWSSARDYQGTPGPIKVWKEWS